MISASTKRISLAALMLLAAAMPAYAALGLGRRFRDPARAAGAACAAVGVGLAFGML